MAEPIKFYTDEHVARSVAVGLRRRGVDVLTAKEICEEARPRSYRVGLRRRGVDVLTVPEANMRGASDADHLRFAAEQARVLFTQDDDFLQLHAEGVFHRGIVYAKQRTPIGDIIRIRGLMLIYHVMSPADMQEHVEFL